MKGEIFHSFIISVAAFTCGRQVWVFFISTWESKLRRLTMSKRTYICPGTKAFCRVCNYASWVWLTSKKSMDLLGTQVQRCEVTVSNAGLKQRWFLSCTKYTSCSADCFPESNCSIYIFIKSLNCMLTGMCVLFHSGYVKNVLLYRAFPDSELWSAVRLFVWVWLVEFSAGSLTRKCNSHNI